MTNKEYYGKNLYLLDHNCGGTSVYLITKHSSPFLLYVAKNNIDLINWLKSEYKPLDRKTWNSKIKRA